MRVVAFHVTLPCINPTDVRHFCWMTYCFSKTIHLRSDQTSPKSWTFSPLGLLPVPLSSALAVFHPWQSFVLLLRFRSLKIKHENRRVRGDGAAIEAQEQTDNWVWECHSRLRSHALKLFFFCFFLAIPFTSLHILFGGKSWTSVCVCNVRLKRDKPQSWLKTVKTHYAM